MVDEGEIINIDLNFTNNMEEENTGLAHEWVKKSLENHGLLKSVVGITTDNSYKLMKNTARALCRDKEIPNLNSTYGDIICLTHVLNVCLKAFINSLTLNEEIADCERLSDQEFREIREEFMMTSSILPLPIWLQHEYLIKTPVLETQVTESDSDIINLLKRINSVFTKLNQCTDSRSQYQNIWKDRCGSSEDIQASHIHPYTSSKWYTTYFSLESLLSNRHIFSQLYDTTHDELYQFTDDDYEMARKVLEVINHAREINEELRSENANISLYLPCMEYFMKKISGLNIKYTETKDTQFANATETCWEKMEEFHMEAKLNPILIIAAYHTGYDKYEFKISEEQNVLRKMYVREYFEDFTLGHINDRAADRESCLGFHRAWLEGENKLRELDGDELFDVEALMTEEIQNLKNLPMEELDKVINNVWESNYFKCSHDKGDYIKHYSLYDFNDPNIIFKTLMKRIIMIQPTTINSKRAFADAEYVESTNHEWASFKKSSNTLDVFVPLMRVKSTLENNLPFTQGDYDYDYYSYDSDYCLVDIYIQYYHESHNQLYSDDVGCLIFYLYIYSLIYIYI